MSKIEPAALAAFIQMDESSRWIGVLTGLTPDVRTALLLHAEVLSTVQVPAATPMLALPSPTPTEPVSPPQARGGFAGMSPERRKEMGRKGAQTRWGDHTPKPKEVNRANGGHARAAALPPEERREIAVRAAQARWAGHTPKGKTNNPNGRPPENEMPQTAAQKRDALIRFLLQNSVPQFMIRNAIDPKMNSGFASLVKRKMTDQGETVPNPNYELTPEQVRALIERYNAEQGQPDYLSRWRLVASLRIRRVGNTAIAKATKQSVASIEKMARRARFRWDLTYPVPDPKLTVAAAEKLGDPLVSLVDLEKHAREESLDQIQRNVAS